MEEKESVWQALLRWLIGSLCGMVFTVLVFFGYFWEVWHLSEVFGLDKTRSTETDAL